VTVPAQHSEQFSSLHTVALNHRVNVGRHPLNAVRDDRNSADYHPRHASLEKSVAERSQRILDQGTVRPSWPWHVVECGSTELAPR